MLSQKATGGSQQVLLDWTSGHFPKIRIVGTLAVGGI